MFYKLLPQDHETIEHDSDDGRRVGGERDMVRVLERDSQFHQSRCHGNKASDDVCSPLDCENEENEKPMR